MKNRIGFIAVGQAGGNIGVKLEQKGYKVLFVNTSKEDLETLGSVKYKHHIKDGEGCNKDRLKAKKAAASDFEEIARKIEEGIDTDFVFVIFSAGGGTGSGSGPMIADLLLSDIAEGNINIKNVGLITILPALNETVKANINAYECFSEISQIEGLSSTFIIDNELGDKMVLNSKFVNTFTSFLDIPSKHKSERGNIDKAEIMESLRAPGMIKVVQVSSKDSKVENVIEKFDKSIYAENEHDGIVKYITISKAGNFDTEILQKETGIPIDVFETYNEHSTICCLSGLTYPAGRLNKTYDSVNEKKDRVMKAMKANTNIEIKEGINFLQDTARGQSVKESRAEGNENKTSCNRRDLLKKYMS